MQDPTFTAAFTQQLKTQFPEHEQLRCPRCDSTNTKFCYYNNYNLSQPRHFCKNCRRYWTKGGSLRNIPVGGGCRKNSKRSAVPTKQQQQQRAVQNPTASTTTTATTTISGSGSALNHNQDQNPSLKVEPVAPIIGGPMIGAQTGSQAGSGVSFTSLLGFDCEGHFGNYQNGLKVGPGQDSAFNVLQGGSESSERFMLNNGLQNGGEANCWGISGNKWPDLAINTPGSNFQ